MKSRNCDPRGVRPKRNLQDALHDGCYPCTQKRLAEKLGVNEGEVSKWIHGKAHMPDERVIETAIIMGVNPLFLLDVTLNKAGAPPADFAAYKEDVFLESMTRIRKRVQAHLEYISQMKDQTEKEAELAKLDSMYPGDYRDIIAFTQTMLEYLPQSPAAQSKHSDSGLVADYFCALACDAIRRTFPQ